MVFKNKRQTKKNLIFTLFLITLFLIPLTLKLSNSNDGSSKRSEKRNTNNEIIEQPSLSANEIIIKTPENITYCKPMSGYYPATYGFENDKNGTVPKEWNTFQYQNIFSKVVGEVGGHKNVIEFYDNNATKWCQLNNTFAPQTSGTVEFYWRGGAENSNVFLYNGPIEVIYMQYDLYWHDYRTYDGITYQSVMGEIPEDTWYHHKIEFDCTTHQFDWYINGVLRGNNKDFRNDENQVNRIVLASRADQANFYTHYDAFSYSWDPKYQIGDNKKEGLLLSYENSTNLKWIGYSLDGAANKTILGNATIPMPANGTHTIQVFGNNTIGTNYQSNKRSFSIGSISLLTPENKTYYNAMSGYYPAMYGFENDKNGDVPKNWDDFSAQNCFPRVVGEVGGHKKVLELYDNNNSLWCALNNTFSPQTSGTVEFYWRGGADNCYMCFYNGPVQTIWTAYDTYWNDYRMYNGITYQSVMGGITEDMWYHHRIEFNCVAHTFDWYIDGVLRGNDKGFVNNENQVDRIYVGTMGGEYNYYAYYDAFSYSWDENYNIGDNKKEGLLLSFENSTNLDWIGYSLDGAANKTILGNATIPMPIVGSHKIQVFGNNSIGTKYQSNIRHFTISPISLITPENKTYTDAMSGYYPATNGFENDLDGALPMGWIDNSYGGSPAPFIETNLLDGHKNYIVCNRGAGSDRRSTAFHNFEEQINGTIEWYWRTSSTALGCYVIVYDKSEAITSGVNLYLHSGKFTYYDTTDHEICNAAINTWHHLRVIFDCSTHKFDCYLNDVLVINDGNMRNPSAFALDTIWIGSDWANLISYYDAFGFNWDPNYNIGDNKKEGLLLGFENSTNLDWIGYSLDGATTEATFGNTTILMPTNGVHTIQLFCNDTSGNYYDSEVIYFTVSVAQIPSTPSTPISSGGDNDGGGDGTTADDSSILLIILVVIVAALVATFSYVLYRYHSKGSKPEKNKAPKPKKEKKPKPPKQRKIKGPITSVKPGLISCPYCFNENPSTAEYCSYCGVNFKETEEKKDELPKEESIIKHKQTKFEEEIDIKNILTKDVILNILRLKGNNPQNFEELLNKIFQNKEEKELIRREISRVPEGTFKDFLIAYEKITKELESKKPEHDFNNENYFNEGRGK